MAHSIVGGFFALAGVYLATAFVALDWGWMAHISEWSKPDRAIFLMIASFFALLGMIAGSMVASSKRA